MVKIGLLSLNETRSKNTKSRPLDNLPKDGFYKPLTKKESYTVMPVIIVLVI